jgi:hypothetical protein
MPDGSTRVSGVKLDLQGKRPYREAPRRSERAFLPQREQGQQRGVALCFELRDRAAF